MSGEEGPLPHREHNALQSTQETGKLRGWGPREIYGELKRRDDGGRGAT
jgi:hypothetical protein